MRRAIAALTGLGIIVALHVAGASAVSPSPCPSPSPSATPASGARVSPTPTCDPNQILYDQLRARLGGDLAKALTAQQNLSAALNQTTANVQSLTDQIAQDEARITDLQNQISQLDSQIADTQGRIDVERVQVATVARAIYRQPDSLLVLIASTGNLRDALVAAADLVVAGQRAHALQAQLEADLAKLQNDRAARQADLDSQNGARDQLVANLSTLNDTLTRQNDISNQLADLILQIQDAQSGMMNLPPDVTASLATLLEQQEQSLIQQSYLAAWNRAQVGAGLAMATGELPTGVTLAGLTLSWPIRGARITQPFGPSDLVLEPPLGSYRHFHTGVDLAGPFGARITAAADGVVVAAVQSRVGYGNYVIVAHGGGVMTLYAHLLEVDVKVGDRVSRGHRLGLEGSSGLSTGPHLHFELRVDRQVTNPMPYLPPLTTAGTT